MKKTTILRELHKKIITERRLLSAVRIRVKCSVCGKITAGRLPRDGNHKGDGSMLLPRRHDVNGKACEGNIEEAQIVNDNKHSR